MGKARIRYSSNPRPESRPYISGDTFRTLARHVFDETAWADPEKIMKGDIVFVASTGILRFFEKEHPLIKNPYVLITHNGDQNISKEFERYIDGKIIRWYAQNADFENEKIVPIPIGIENAWWNNNGIVKNFDRARAFSQDKKAAIAFAFNAKTNLKERVPAIEALRKNHAAEEITGWPRGIKYLKILGGYEFVASPPGNGIDCIRTWESLCLKTIPIVKDSPATRYFRSIGLPLLLIRQWSELEGMNREKLHKKYGEMRKGFSCEAIYFDYWEEKIKKNER